MKKPWSMMFILVLALSFTGCSLLSGDTAGGTQQSGTAAKNTEATGQSTAPESTSTEGTQPSDSGTNAKTVKVTLFFANEDNSALKQEEREVQVVDGAILKACVEALIDGPAGKGLRQTVPEGTVLRGISIKDKVATVDLSKEFLHTEGLSEVVARLSVVNTLTKINGIEKVRLHIEGEDMIGPSGMPLGDMEPAKLDAEGKPLAGQMKTQ